MIDIRCGDMLQVVPTLGAGAFDAIVCDPPYHLTSIVKRFGNDNAAPAKVGKTGAFARASAGFMGQKWDGGDIALRPETWALLLAAAKPGTHLVSFGGSRTYHRMAVAMEDAGWEIRDCIMWLYGSGFPKSHNQRGEWDGWGTALKPAHEPIILARRPLAGTVEKNLAAHRVGALNIEASRIPFASEADEQEAKGKNQHAAFGSGPMTNQVFGKFTKDRDNYDPEGRWPANVIHDGLGEEWARFFYCAKATRADREAGLDHLPEKPLLWSAGTQNPGSFQSPNTKKAARNNHPTVKPTDLMRYLCRLVTPPGGVVLDPFMGSGSTGKAAVLEGFGFIGIDQKPEYVEIARHRIHHAAGLATPTVSGLEAILA